MRTLPDRLRREGDRILDTLGPRWNHALLSSVARWIFDYMRLLAALAAIGSHPRPSLALLLAGVDPGDAVLAPFAYRLF